MIERLRALVVGGGRAWEQGRELDALRAEVATLRRRNARLERAMRRCLTCDYRLEVKQQRRATAAPSTEESTAS